MIATDHSTPPTADSHATGRRDSSTSDGQVGRGRPLRLIRGLAICLVAVLPALVLRVSGAEVPAPVALAAFGAAVVAASFVLAWAADAARKDISGPLAVSLLALVAVLPEYAVDLYYAFRSGSDAAYLPFAAANMNGSNRLLLGLGWPLVVLLSLWAARRIFLTPDAGGSPAAADAADRPESPARTRVPRALRLPTSARKDVAFLAVLTVVALLIPILGAIPLWFGIAGIAAFVAYLWSSSRTQDNEEAEEDFLSLAADIAALPRRSRRWLVGVLFVVAAGVILASAEPFAESLVATGTSTGIDPYFLVQWLAPLASESPEFIVAALFALSGRGTLALGTLIASKINQWSLLVGSLPVAHLLGGGGTELPLDGRQIEEFALTASQALLGVAILISLRFHRNAAIALAALFAVQFAVTGTEGRWVLTGIHAGIALVLLVRHRAEIAPTLASLGSMFRAGKPAKAVSPAMEE